ncbi:hypothetical protein STRTUCAR8_03291 [Streptomyces turgidiscabies Car8]|uniref:Uncharacterized protein n=1 Tax=Streptomyces turgidiscabies (strain Car8) TaxID=698760 RepID=L7F0K6_STRT8|nr:hypothetical protein STRTUCAR8_03291 [Streptomyces turgidiscabies Car8]
MEPAAQPAGHPKLTPVTPADKDPRNRVSPGHEGGRPAPRTALHFGQTRGLNFQ